MKAETGMNENYVIIGEFIARNVERKGKSENSLGREKRIAAALGLAVVLGLTGCAGTEAASENTQEKVTAGTGEQAGSVLQETEKSGGKVRGAQTDGEAKDGSPNDLTMQEGEWEREQPVLAQERETADTGMGEGKPNVTEEKGQMPEGSQETVYLGGKVQNPQAEGMTLAQTTLTDEDGMVTLLEVKDAKKIPVKFTADTKVERWTIQGGGADIDMREAAVSDLAEGMGVELEGYYDGETFVAVRVIMEEYV